MTQVALSERDAGRQILLSCGDQLVIELTENPTTGYRWTFEPFDETILARTRSTFVRFSAKTGAGGRRSLSLLAKTAGTVRLRLKLWRASTHEDAPVQRRFEVELRVREREAEEAALAHEPPKPR